MQLEELNTTTTNGEDVHPVVSSGDYHNDWGWNAGGGIAWHMGRTEVYLESRVVQFSRGSSDDVTINGINVSGRGFESARQIPIIFGLNFF
jgi:hypothetical protein